MFLEQLDHAACVGDVLSKWEVLAKQAADPNPFYEHWFLLPAIERMAAQRIHLLFVWEDEQRKKLLGLFPLCVENSFRGIPVKRTGLWRHLYCYLCTPLLIAEQRHAILEHVFDWIRQNKELPSFTSFYWINGDSQLAEQWLPSGNPDRNNILTGFRTDGNVRSVTRAILTLDQDFEKDYLPALRTKKRKDWQRNWRRLAELGNRRTDIFSADSPVSLFDQKVSEFLELEDNGWKRDQGTSLKSVPTHASFFRVMLQNAQAKGQAIILQIRCDDLPVGMVTVVTSACGRAAYTLKIASHPDFHRYSIGSQVILQLTEYALSSMTVELIDSCAAEDHPMINRLWQQRRNIENLLFSNKNATIKALIPLTDITVDLVRKVSRATA